MKTVLKYSVLMWLLWQSVVVAAPDVTMSFSTASSGSTITASEHNTVRNETASKFNSHTHTDISQTASTLNIGASSGATSIAAASLIFEGTTNNDFETTFSITDPTADRTITVPNANGFILPSGSIFISATSCPTGTTEVSSTYAGYFVIGTTVTTSAAAGASQLIAHTHTGPSHTHTSAGHAHNILVHVAGQNMVTGQSGSGSSTSGIVESTTPSATGSSGTDATGSTGASNNFATLKLCQID